MILFAAWQIKAGENATIPVRYLKNRTVLWGSIYLLFDNMANYIVSKHLSSRYIGPRSAYIFTAHLLHPLLLPSGPWSLAVEERRRLHCPCRSSDGWIAGWRRHHNSNRALREPGTLLISPRQPMSFYLDARHSGGASDVRHWLRASHDASIRHQDTHVGDVLGLDWSWTRSGSQYPTYCYPGCHTNVSSATLLEISSY